MRKKLAWLAVLSVVGGLLIFALLRAYDAGVELESACTMAQGVVLVTGTGESRCVIVVTPMGWK